jgi:hypothetical protein
MLNGFEITKIDTSSLMKRSPFGKLQPHNIIMKWRLRLIKRNQQANDYPVSPFDDGPFR